MVFWFRSSEIDFQDGFHSGHLGFWIRTILAIFVLQVSQMPPTKFQVNWPLGSGEEGKNIISRCPHLGFPNRTILVIFDVQVTLMLLPTKFKVNWPLGSGEEGKNTISRCPPS